MEIKGTFVVGFHVEAGKLLGWFNTAMWHSSRLVLDGQEVLVHDSQLGEGIISAPLAKLMAADTILSETRGSSLAGKIIAVANKPMLDIEGKPTLETKLDVTVEGKAEGSQASITGGLACHCRWEIKEVREVSGRFGRFTGKDALEKYNATKNKARSRWIREQAVPSEYDPARVITVLTAEGKAAALRLGYVPSTGWELDNEGNAATTPHFSVTHMLPKTGPEENRRYETVTFWADQIEGRLREQEKKERLEMAAKLYNPPPGAVDARIIRPASSAGRMKVEWIMAQ